MFDFFLVGASLSSQSISTFVLTSHIGKLLLARNWALAWVFSNIFSFFVEM